MSALHQIWFAIKGLIVSADPITIGIALVVILIAGLVLGRFGNLLNGTALALIGFAFVKYIVTVFRGGVDAVDTARADWNAFVHFSVLTLLAYVVVFAVLIAIVHFIRSAVNR
jgi:hypothetical protein